LTGIHRAEFLAEREPIHSIFRQSLLRRDGRPCDLVPLVASCKASTSKAWQQLPSEKRRAATEIQPPRVQDASFQFIKRSFRRRPPEIRKGPRAYRMLLMRCKLTVRGTIPAGDIEFFSQLELYFRASVKGGIFMSRRDYSSCRRYVFCAEDPRGGWRRWGLKSVFREQGRIDSESARSKAAIDYRRFTQQKIDSASLATELKADDELRSIPLLGFFSHVQTELQRNALAAGFDQVIHDRLRARSSQNYYPRIIRG
jgi:hypothetical protein